MGATWAARVSAYVDELEQVMESIDGVLEKSHVDTSLVNAEELEKSITELTQRLAELEQLVADRQQLLSDEDAPNGGLTITEKLLRTGMAEEIDLAKRCRQVAARVEDTNHRAISLFVCQYHLADLSSEIIRIISGETAPPTYDATAGTASQVRPAGGGLLNESG